MKTNTKNAEQKLFILLLMNLILLEQEKDNAALQVL